MLGKKNTDQYSNITSSDRDEAIRRLERERMKVNLEIESVLKLYAKESGNSSLSRRKHKMGSSPNDYSYNSIVDKKSK